MDAFKLAVKFFATDAAPLPGGALVPVYHKWIQSKALPDHLLVDVADYHHVVNGPGTVLVAHEANFSLDSAGGRPGLLYNRKQPAEGTFADRLRQTFRAALEACRLLEQEALLGGQVRFRTDDPLFRIYDRLLAPNTPETFVAVRPQLETFLANLYGGHVTLSQHGERDALFEVKVKAASSPTVGDLLAKLGSPQVVGV